MSYLWFWNTEDFALDLATVDTDEVNLCWSPDLVTNSILSSWPRINMKKVYFFTNTHTINAMVKVLVSVVCNCVLGPTASSLVRIPACVCVFSLVQDEVEGP